MSIDPARYGLITNEYRWKELFNTAVSAAYLKARELEITSNFDLGTITNLLTDIYNVVSVARRRFALDLIGTDFIGPNDFAPRTPAFYFTAPEFNVTALPVIVTRVTLVESENKTSLEIWG